MKHSLIVALCSVLLSSCSSTFYLTTVAPKSEDLEQVENGDFLFENDSLWIAYCFNGENAPIQITIFNKLDEPFVIDWQKSSLIINDDAMSYAPQTAQTSGYSITHPRIFVWDDHVTESHLVQELPQYMTYIPPQSRISKTPLRLDYLSFENIPDSEYKKSLFGDKYGESHKVKKINFDQDNSPLIMRSRLVLYSEDEKGERIGQHVFEQSFFVDKIFKTKGLGPKKLYPDLANKGNLFFIEKPANKTFLHILGGTAVIVGVSALDYWLDTDSFADD